MLSRQSQCKGETPGSKKRTTNPTELLLQYVAQPEPMLSMLERLNFEILRCTGIVGIFPCAETHTISVTTYLMEYAEDWSASRAYLSKQSVQTMLRQAA